MAASALTALMAMAVVGILVHPHLPLRTPSWWWVAAASTSFVGVSCLSLAACRDFSAGAVTLGLMACWLGDMTGPVSFTAVVLSFLAAHGLFIVAWAQRGFAWHRVPWVALCVVAATASVAVWLLPHVPAGDANLVVAYMVVIATMVVAAGGVKTPWWPFTLAAGMLFFASDIAVARGRFVAPGPENAWLCYPLYYPACWMLAVSPVITRVTIQRATSQEASGGRASC
jgi:hypothetical protein